MPRGNTNSHTLIRPASTPAMSAAAAEGPEGRNNLAHRTSTDILPSSDPPPALRRGGQRRRGERGPAGRASAPPLYETITSTTRPIPVVPFHRPLCRSATIPPPAQAHPIPSSPDPSETCSISSQACVHATSAITPTSMLPRRAPRAFHSPPSSPSHLLQSEAHPSPDPL